MGIPREVWHLLIHFIFVSTSSRTKNWTNSKQHLKTRLRVYIRDAWEKYGKDVHGAVRNRMIKTDITLTNILSDWECTSIYFCFLQLVKILIKFKRNYCFLAGRKILKDYKVISKSDELWKIPLDTPTFSFRFFLSCTCFIFAIYKSKKNVRILLNFPNHMSYYVNTTRYCIWHEPIAMVIWDNKM